MTNYPTSKKAAQRELNESRSYRLTLPYVPVSKVLHIEEEEAGKYALEEFTGASGEGMGMQSHYFTRKKGSFSECYQYFLKIKDAS